jgi:hypothetical protein
MRVNINRRIAARKGMRCYFTPCSYPNCGCLTKEEQEAFDKKKLTEKEHNAFPKGRWQ